MHTLPPPHDPSWWDRVTSEQLALAFYTLATPIYVLWAADDARRGRWAMAWFDLTFALWFGHYAVVAWEDAWGQRSKKRPRR